MDRPRKRSKLTAKRQIAVCKMMALGYGPTTIAQEIEKWLSLHGFRRVESRPEILCERTLAAAV